MGSVLLLLLFYGVGLLGTLILAPCIPFFLFTGALEWRRTRRLPRQFLVALAMLCGFVGGAAVVWSAIPSEWTLPLWKTFEAAGNAAKYGHQTEHYAEIVVFLMITAAVLAAAAAGGVTAVAWRRLKQKTA